MKLFSWAHRKLLHNSSPGKHLNADRFFELPKASNEDAQANTSKDTHAEVLTIGTLGVGNLLSMHANDDGNGNDNDDYHHDYHTYEEEEKHELAHNVSPNLELVSSVDIQKMQEELQKILYFKLEGPLKSENNTGKRKNDKNNSNSNNNNNNNGYGRSYMQAGERRSVFPLHNFLEMPMDAQLPPPPPLSFLHTKQWLLQGLRRKVLTRVKISPSLFDKLIRTKANITHVHHGSSIKVDKVLQLFRRGSFSHNKNNEGCEENDDRLKLALTRPRGSERFINYMSKVADLAEYQNQLIIHEGQVQLMLNSAPANECWIKTDDEYLVLEL